MWRKSFDRALRAGDDSQIVEAIEEIREMQRTGKDLKLSASEGRKLLAMMESKVCLSTPEAQAKLLDCFAEFLTHPTPNGRLHTNFQPFAAASFLKKLAVFYNNILNHSIMTDAKIDRDSAIKPHESFQELCRDIEESVKINSRHARKCYMDFMTSIFKIIGQFLAQQLLKGGTFDVPLLRRTVNDLDTIIRTAMNTSKLGGQCSRFMHTTADAFAKSPLSQIIAKAFMNIGDAVFQSVILNSMFLLSKGGLKAQDVARKFKMEGIAKLLAGSEKTFFQNVKKVLRQHMVADTKTTTSTFKIKAVVATHQSKDFPLHDRGNNGLFFRKQWGCTIFRGDAKTPLTLLPQEIGLAKKVSSTTVRLPISRDTMDACGVHVHDLEINDDHEVNITITLMSPRSMQQFLLEISNMKMEMAGKKAPKCRKTLVFQECNDKKSPLSAKSSVSQEDFPEHASPIAPKSATKPATVVKKMVSPVGQATLKDKQNAKVKKLRQSPQPPRTRRTRAQTQDRTKTTKPLQQVKSKDQKLINAPKYKTSAHKEEKEQKKTNSRSRRPALSRKRVLPSKAKAEANIQKKRSKVVAFPKPKPISLHGKKVSSSPVSSLDDSTSDSIGDSAVLSEDSSDDSNDFSNLSDSSDSSDGSDLSPTSQAPKKKAKAISFTQRETPKSENNTSSSCNSRELIADLDGGSSTGSNASSDLDSESDSDSGFAELLKMAVSQKKKLQKQQKAKVEQKQEQRQGHQKKEQRQPQQRKRQLQEQQRQQQQKKRLEQQRQLEALKKQRSQQSNESKHKNAKRDRENAKKKANTQLSKKRRIVPACSLLERFKKAKSPAPQKQTARAAPSTTPAKKIVCQFVTARMQTVISTMELLKKQTCAFDMAVRDVKARQVAETACDALKVELQAVIEEQQMNVLRNIEDKKQKLDFARHKFEKSVKRIKAQLKSLLTQSQTRHASFVALLKLEPLETRVKVFETNLDVKSTKRRSTVAAFVKATAMKAKRALAKIKTDDAKKRALMLATLQAAESEEESDD